MSIWFRPITLEDARRTFGDGGDLAHHLGIELTAIGTDFLSGSMPVDERTRQPFGLLHGGASVALAETLGSMAANFCVDTTKVYCVGQEINANHVRSARSGHVTGTARPIHLGSRSQVWDIRIEDEGGRLTCVSRLTMSVIEAPGQGADHLVEKLRSRG
ncbi:MAG TPA: hotdog fold thioesterase [Steroidobacteraceae bacterium]|jgi:1,4-dihydroxy-2-naphthoyl-CoA hydrolase|nr:hotdog fold thioesterase [Steroidobacteraceae bacterium]